ncbi:conserved protein, unknown function [Plasmodium gallinaceum]|uniref:TMEM205-like domain-containing protein n=1 Tax=Plasmodium gallinaceum TaxID=5849 RepID=A0A1J1GXJ2_PLAGA|nr:conserved protein, unknown function [Plasmodium gallinaceum]CRG97014.1 conserved protein, unknown function [Plasmodium gallinaceum]
MGCTFSNLRCVTNFTGLSSLIISLFPNLIIKNPEILRPLLNVSWGYLFGSTFWLCFFSEVGVLRGLKDIKSLPLPENAEDAKRLLEEHKGMESDFNRRSVDFQYFFSLSTLFSGILLLSTVRLATHNIQLRISSSVVAISCLLNSLYFYNKIYKLKQTKVNLYNELIENPKSDTAMAALKKNKKEFHIYHGLSILSLYLSFFGLTPYIFT